MRYMCIIIFVTRMNFLITFIITLVLYQLFANAGHTYHFGSSCAKIKPMPNFNMDKLTGTWYAIQKTSTLLSRCLSYNFMRTEQKNKYHLQELSENSVIAIVKNNVVNYTGELTFPNENNRALMTVKFPYSISWFSGAEYIVFTTDYENYAGVYTCQKLMIAHRQSATILSRTRTLDKKLLDKVRKELASFNVNPYDLSEINQNNCNFDTGFKFNIGNKILSVENIEKAARNMERSTEKAAMNMEITTKKVTKNVTEKIEVCVGDGNLYSNKRTKKTSKNKEGKKNFLIPFMIYGTMLVPCFSFFNYLQNAILPVYNT